MSLNAGDLNRYITIQQRTLDTDELNQQLDDWVYHSEVWANYKTQTGMGVVKAKAEGVEIPLTSCSWRIRYNVSISVGMRVLYQGQAMDIVAIRHDLERRAWTDLICEQGGNNG